MEGIQNSEILVALGTLTLLFIVLFIIVFALFHKRKMIAKQNIIDLLENECKEEIKMLRQESDQKIKELQDQINKLKE